MQKSLRCGEKNKSILTMQMKAKYLMKNKGKAEAAAPSP